MRIHGRKFRYKDCLTEKYLYGTVRKTRRFRFRVLKQGKEVKGYWRMIVVGRKHLINSNYVEWKGIDY